MKEKFSTIKDNRKLTQTDLRNIGSICVGLEAVIDADPENDQSYEEAVSKILVEYEKLASLVRGLLVREL